jgi:GNAT superfamily N-acetyltransferase
MPWQRAAASRRGLYEPFLREREGECVNIVSRLVRDRPRGHCLAIDQEKLRVRNLVYSSGHGLVLPVFRTNAAGDGRTLRRLVGANIQTVIGCTASVANFEQSVGLGPAHRCDYYLMQLDPVPATPLPDLPCGARLRMAAPADAGSLFPLQEAYEREEVLLRPDQFDPAQSWQSFLAGLARELVIWAELDGRPVAKAGTNARGWRWDQIGGVYTRPDFRNLGFAAALMAQLLGLIRRSGRAACLFVKKSNPAARHLYEKLGFRQFDDFAIDYFF